MTKQENEQASLKEIGIFFVFLFIVGIYSFKNTVEIPRKSLMYSKVYKITNPSNTNATKIGVDKDVPELKLKAAYFVYGLGKFDKKKKEEPDTYAISSKYIKYTQVPK